MKLRFNHKRKSQRGGIALIMVLMVITVLGVIAFGFAKSMSVEVKLARNASFDAETEWLGRSGVELARYVLAEHLSSDEQGYDTTNQFWAGGVRGTNANTEGLLIKDHPLGAGSVSLDIINLESFMNINLADDAMLRTALEIIGVEATQTAEIVDAILDWRDTDDNPLLNGAESDYYLSLSPPYMPKNGPIDDMEELLQIKGITPEIFYGPNGTNGGGALPSGGRVGPPGSKQPEVGAAVGLRDLFTAISAGLPNRNIASEYVVQVVTADAMAGQDTVKHRAGPDGVHGTEDDNAYKNAGEFPPGLDATAMRMLQARTRHNAATFQATITVKLNNKERQMVAILRRTSRTDVKVLMQYWK